MIKGTGYWTYDGEEGEGVWYFGLDERAAPPYRTQVQVLAILDLDADGRLAGIEIIDNQPDGKPITPPRSVTERK